MVAVLKTAGDVTAAMGYTIYTSKVLPLYPISAVKSLRSSALLPSVAKYRHGTGANRTRGMPGHHLPADMSYLTKNLQKVLGLFFMSESIFCIVQEKQIFRINNFENMFSFYTIPNFEPQ